MKDKKDKEERVVLKVVGRQKADRHEYYNVVYDGEEYSVRMWDFQIGKELPAELTCLITKSDHGLDIKQDPAAIVSQLYPVGTKGTFRVKRKFAKFYTVIDSNGWISRLTDFDRSTHLFEGQSIDAEVISVHQTNVNLRLLRYAPDNREVPFRSVEHLAEVLNVSAPDMLQIAAVLSAQPKFEDLQQMYLSGDGHWLLEAVMRIESMFLCHVGAINDQLAPYLGLFHELSIYIVEESDILRNMPDDRRREWIERLTRAARHTEDYQEAYSILGRGCEREWIDRQLRNLQASENLYQPERKFRVITSILNLREELMSDMVDRIFEIIIKGNKTHWQSEPFRTAFVNMLELFIDQYREKAVRYKDRSLLKKVVTAIAIQQFLSKAEDDINRRLNNATFRRLLAYLGTEESEAILAMAFDSLFTPFKAIQEYEWKDIDNVHNLYLRTLWQVNKPRPARQLQVLRTDDLELTVDASGLRLRPLTGFPVSALPEGLLGWNFIDVQSNFPPKNRIKSNPTFETVVKYWRELEDNLHRKPMLADKIRPEKGERVTIKVLTTSEDFQSLYCEIVDDRFVGKGWLDLSKITNYMQGSESIESYFMDPDGAPLLFDVNVIDYDGSDLEFSMLDVIEDYFQSIYYPGSIIECNIRGIDKFISGFALGVSREGASVKMRVDDGDDPQQYVGKVVKVRVIESNRLAQNQYICEYCDTGDTYFKKDDAFANLLATLGREADQEVLAEPQLEVEMDSEVVSEIILILDRLAEISTNRIHTYGYLSLASLLASMIDDDVNVGYYEKRKTLVRYTDEYERSGYVDESRLATLIESMGDDLINSDYQVNESISKFRILDALRHRENVQQLFDIRSGTSNQSVQKAADLAISLLLTRRFNIDDFTDRMQDMINKELGVKTRVSKLRNFGQESDTVEFKTSIVYPSNNHMQPNRPMQEDVILKTVCSFLNSPRGGDLYFGVNDQGTACGVKNDLDFLHLNEDGYERYIRALINASLGQVALQCCSEGEWIEDGGYRIFLLHIKPAPEMLPYNGQYWRRIGNEKRLIKPENLEQLRALRQQEYNKLAFKF